MREYVQRGKKALLATFGVFKSSIKSKDLLKGEKGQLLLFVYPDGFVPVLYFLTGPKSNKKPFYSPAFAFPWLDDFFANFS